MNSKQLMRLLTSYRNVFCAGKTQLSGYFDTMLESPVRNLVQDTRMIITNMARLEPTPKKAEIQGWRCMMYLKPKIHIL